MIEFFDGLGINTQPQFWISVLQIIWINVLLSGDNAIVIALACRSLPPKQRAYGQRHMEACMSWLGKLEKAKAEMISRNADPWRLRLGGLKGKKWDDGIERLSTQTVFDILEVPYRSRTTGACRRLSKLMRELAWHPIKARGLTPGGFRDQVRGYARDTLGQTVM